MSIDFSDSRMPSTADQVTRDVNQIARNFACHGTSAAAAETANHIRRFWAPTLRTVLVEQARAHPDRFSQIASEAVARLEAPKPETSVGQRTSARARAA